MTTATPEFIYDAIRKVAVARGVGDDGRVWTIEFHARHDDDSMSLVIVAPDGEMQKLTRTEDEFTFGEDTVTIGGATELTLRMAPLYLNKLRGFTRGNIPTPDIAGPNLP